LALGRAPASRDIPPGEPVRPAPPTNPFPIVRANRGRRALAIVAIVAIGCGVDVRRAPDHQWSAALALGGIRFYQQHVSQWMPALGVRCRFQPTCSHYAAESIKRHGALVGGWRAFTRILRCGPWTPAGTVDPPK
jgi:putative membrane protein insertion efficiency factor